MSGHGDVLDPRVVALHYYIARDRVSGRKFVQLGSRLHYIWHDHRTHEAGNLLAIDVGHVGPLIDRDNLAFEVVAFG